MRNRMNRRMIATAWVIVLALGGASARAQQPPPALGDSPAALVERARAAYTQGRYHDAQAQALAPTDNTTRYRVALFATRVGDYDRALRELDAILATQPKAAQLFFQWAPPSMQKPLLKHSP